MSYVEEVVKRRLSAGPSDFMFQQSVRIPERTHQRLRAMAEWMGVPKTTLLAELVIAAIDQALEALPDERWEFMDHVIPNPDFEALTGHPVPETVRQYVRYRADELYEQAVLERKAPIEMQGHSVREEE
jgi:hypothetical protein